jgi:ADP-heptose:LPS heptosyltransferase
MKIVNIHTDCRFYHSDRPCAPHKKTGITCDSCVQYDQIVTKILIVKLDAIGDVLRTTCLLTGLKQKYPNSWITWVTKKASTPLLTNNSFVDEVAAIEDTGLAILLTTTFDVVINPDASSDACRYATLAKGAKKFGFVWSDHGAITPLNQAAEAWYLMGLDDKTKKGNSRTYQSIVLDICELPQSDHPIIWNLSDQEKQFSARFAAAHNILKPGVPVIGLNTGAGGRWKWKKWTSKGYTELIEKLLSYFPDSKILLYGGVEEKERNQSLCVNKQGRVVDTGYANSLREFGALVNLCDILVTGDTLGLHLATALGKRIVALFGPTSAAEIELYGQGVKLQPKNMSCLCCYRSDCEVAPACMENISPDEVFAAIKTQYELILNAV